MNISFKTGEELFQFFIIVILLLFTLILLGVVVNIFMILKRINQGEAANAAGAEPERSFWSSLTNAVPIDKEDSVLLHHDYDGIKELDNHLPPWWLGLFYGCIVFGIVYLLNYHVWQWSPLQTEEYELSMTEAKAEVEAYQAKLGDSIDEKSAKVDASPKAIAEGKIIFTEKCVACHGANGEGGVGPNLTDEYWLHGGSINDIFGVIKHGVPEKGMISWKATLKPKQIQDVANYIITLKGTNPSNPKAPQGEKYEGGGDATTADAAAPAETTKM
jgi:cytochrome c oxidase cbb3-type subunit III